MTIDYMCKKIIKEEGFLINPAKKPEPSASKKVIKPFLIKYSKLPLDWTFFSFTLCLFLHHRMMMILLIYHILRTRHDIEVFESMLFSRNAKLYLRVERQIPSRDLNRIVCNLLIHRNRRFRQIIRNFYQNIFPSIFQRGKKNLSEEIKVIKNISFFWLIKYSKFFSFFKHKEKINFSKEYNIFKLAKYNCEKKRI